MNKNELIDNLCQNLADILKKNADYDDSFAKSLDKWGASAYFIRDEDKTNRLANLLAGAKPNVQESVHDTLMDKAGYAILMAVELTIRQESDRHKGASSALKD